MMGGDWRRECPMIGTLRVYADPAGKPFCLCWD
jgi:hypothetical protein